MDSPFPGMDPYIEACGLWEDFHGHLIMHVADTLADAIPDRYFVRTGKRSYLVLVTEEDRGRSPSQPDVITSASETQKEPGKEPESKSIRAFIDEEHREAFVEVYEHTPEQGLVTCLEVLSPANKLPGTPGWDIYQQKRRSLMLGGVNLVEIDLLRGGQRMPMLDPWPNSPYTLLIARANKAPQSCRVWPAFFQRRLPTIPVPLVKPDVDITLDLQPLIEFVYRRHRYDRSIDYRKPLTPALAPDQVAWLKQQLKARQSQT